MAQSYFEEFWIVTNKGEKLYPALIKNRASGKASYRLLADGSNKQSDGYETSDPLETIKMFLNFQSMRFGRSGGGPDNRFKRGSRFVVGIGATLSFMRDYPHLRW